MRRILDSTPYKPFISYIQPYLYLGNFEAAANPISIINSDIELIVSVTDKPEHRPSKNFCEEMHLNQILFEIPDAVFQDTEKRLTKIIFPAMAKSETNKQNMLVHCLASVSRSPSLVITYLMTQGMNFNDAFLSVMANHPLAAPAPEVLNSFLQCINAGLPEYYAEICRARRSQLWWKKMIDR